MGRTYIRNLVACDIPVRDHGMVGIVERNEIGRLDRASCIMRFSINYWNSLRPVLTVRISPLTQKAIDSIDSIALNSIIVGPGCSVSNSQSSALPKHVHVLELVFVENASETH